MMGNYHVRFLGGKGAVTPLTYPVREEKMRPSKISFMEKFSKLPDEDYSVRIIAMMNNYEFKNCEIQR